VVAPRGKPVFTQQGEMLAIVRQDRALLPGSKGKLFGPFEAQPPCFQSSYSTVTVGAQPLRDAHGTSSSRKRAMNSNPVMDERSG
jgi:hypothetical protein